MSTHHTNPRDRCPTVEPLLSSFVAGALDEAGERQVRDHLAACPDCRAAVTARDPSVLFLELRRTPLPDRFWDDFRAGLRKRLEAERRPGLRLPGWMDLLGARRLAYVGGPLVMILLLGTLFLVRPGGPGFRNLVHPGAVRSPYATQPGGGRPDRAGVPQGPAGMSSLPIAPGGPPLLEEVGSPSARVYTFSVGEGSDATPIYFVVDESIDI